MLFSIEASSATEGKCHPIVSGFLLVSFYSRVKEKKKLYLSVDVIL